jgi:carboxyl-terminal processing protease
MKLTDFTSNASKEVKKALNDLKDKGAKHIILDLRDNPGGLLSEAINISNLFIPKDKEIVSTKGKIAEWNKIYNALNAAVDTDISLVVLTNNRSASASEIVAGVMQDYDRGVLIGQRSYGKGLVQATRPLSYNSQLKITTAKYYTPSGRCIQALDYSHRNDDGSVDKVPDSLITAFKTKNGRIVYDGGGVAPDITIEPRKVSGILGSLVTKSLIFDYATKYRIAHETIPTAREFKLTDAEYNDFIAFLDNKEYDYTTKTEKALEAFRTDAKTDKSIDLIGADIDALKNKIMHNKKEDLINYKPEIKQYLEEEIASRYYFQNGRLEASLKDDPELAEATALLNDTERYNKILTTVGKTDKPLHNPGK